MPNHKKIISKLSSVIPKEVIYEITTEAILAVIGVFRDVMKSVLDTRPIFHKCDVTIRGHVFCSFLALVLRKELNRRQEAAGHQFEWADIKRDLKALVTVEESGRSLAVRTACGATVARCEQAVGVALPPTIREI